MISVILPFSRHMNTWKQGHFVDLSPLDRRFSKEDTHPRHKEMVPAEPVNTLLF